MILICSWFDREKVGKVLGISLGSPGGIRIDGRVDMLFPTWKIVRGYRRGEISVEEYVERYVELLRVRYRPLRAWLDSIDEDVTLCCFEREGEFCHRLLVAWVIGRMNPGLEVRLR